MNFHNPDYNGNSIVNLISSILAKYNISSSYPLLTYLPEEIVKESSNLVLFIIDGLGNDFFQKNGENSFLADYKRGKITSVFPSTTAAAMLTFYTGFAPIQHGIPAWFTYLQEIGSISAILPLTQRGFKQKLSELGLDPEKIYPTDSLFQNIPDKQYLLLPEDLIDAPLSKIIGKDRNLRGFSDLQSMFDLVNDLLTHQPQNPPQNKLITVYWPELDHIAHIKGVSHPETISHFHEIDQKFQKYLPKWKSMDLANRFIITADHGLIDNPRDQQFHLDSYPEIKNCLVLPLAGEPRVPFFYVRVDKKVEFEQAMEKNFKGKGQLFTRKELLDSGLLGLPSSHNILNTSSHDSRLGDYIFIFNQAFVLRDTLLTEEKHFFVGNHGGLSEEEILIPLFVI